MTKDHYKVGITGLSPDMEDFILEQHDHYSLNKTKFWSSFWEICSSMWSNGIDLSNRQLDIIKEEYKKVEKNRKK